MPMDSFLFGRRPVLGDQVLQAGLALAHDLRGELEGISLVRHLLTEVGLGIPPLLRQIRKLPPALRDPEFCNLHLLSSERDHSRPLKNVKKKEPM